MDLVKASQPDFVQIGEKVSSAARASEVAAPANSVSYSSPSILEVVERLETLSSFLSHVGLEVDSY